MITLVQIPTGEIGVFLSVFLFCLVMYSSQNIVQGEHIAMATLQLHIQTV